MSRNNIFKMGRDYDHHHYRNDFPYYHSGERHDFERVYYPPDATHYLIYIVRKLWTNKRLRLLLILSVVFLTALLILILILIIPLLGKIIDIIGQEGLKGVFQSVQGFLESLWNGSNGTN